MILNNREFDFKFSSLNADDMERYDKATQHIVDRDEAFKDSGITKTYEAIRFHCHTIFEFFNIMFGEGTDRKIFGDETDLGTCFRVLAEFTGSLGEDAKDVVGIAAKYMSNRIERVK